MEQETSLAEEDLKPGKDEEEAGEVFREEEREEEEESFSREQGWTKEGARRAVKEAAMAWPYLLCFSVSPLLTLFLCVFVCMLCVCVCERDRERGRERRREMGVREIVERRGYIICFGFVSCF